MFSHQLTSVGLHENLVQILLDLLDLNRYGWTKNFNAISVRKCIYLAVARLQCLSIERRLLCYGLHPSFNGGGIAGCCRISGLLYINTALWCNYPSASAILRNLSRRLQATLDVETINDFCVAAPEWLLWVLFIGYFATEGQDTSLWFLYQFEVVAAVLRVRDVEQMNSVLKMFLDIPEIYDGAAYRLWARSSLEASMAQRGTTDVDSN